MLQKTLAAAAMMALFASPALAIECPGLMAEIDTALARNPQLTDAQLAEVRDLRKRGEEEHVADDHGYSVSLLEKALAILGLR